MKHCRTTSTCAAQPKASLLTLASPAAIPVCLKQQHTLLPPVSQPTRVSLQCHQHAQPLCSGSLEDSSFPNECCCCCVAGPLGACARVLRAPPGCLPGTEQAVLGRRVCKKSWDRAPGESCSWGARIWGFVWHHEGKDQTPSSVSNNHKDNAPKPEPLGNEDLPEFTTTHSKQWELTPLQLWRSCYKTTGTKPWGTQQVTLAISTRGFCTCSRCPASTARCPF